VIQFEIMGKLITVVGASGVGKTTLVTALTGTGKFAAAFEQHAERPFQSLFKQDARYALANQIDYLLFRAEQERQLRASSLPGLIDGGLDLDFHGFTRLFRARGLLSGAEYNLCARFYTLTRQLLPPPELIVHLTASHEAIAARLAARSRINIASAEDTALFNSFLKEWLAGLPPGQVIELDVTNQSINYTGSVELILDRVRTWNNHGRGG
jgi:deoxyadenosine/deoxycytidine kinase